MKRSLNEWLYVGDYLHHTQSSESTGRKKNQPTPQLFLSLQIFLAEVTFKTAQNFLLEGHHEDAIPAALHSLKFSISIYGPDSAELVPAYLALAETSLGEPQGGLPKGERGSEGQPSTPSLYDWNFRLWS